MPTGFYVHRAKLPAFYWITHAVFETFLLLLVIHRKPILYEDDARANQHFFEEGARSQELLIFLLCAKAHDALNAGAVVPAPVEQNDLTGRGQFRHISLEIPLPALPLGRSGEGDDAAHAGFSGSVMRLMTPPLPAASRPSKMTHILRRLCLTYSCNLISSTWRFMSSST